MIEWERARTLKQKASREQEIFKAAKHLLSIKPFDSIKLSDISEHISFSRATIYQYFSTKEEIYLALLAKEIESFGIKVRVQLLKTKTKQKNPKRFCEVWVSLLSKEKVMLNLLSMAGTVLEKNCSDTILLQSKSSMAHTIRDSLVPAMREYFPNSNDENLTKLIMFCTIIANGFFPFCGLNDAQQKILRTNGLGTMIHDFESDYKKMIADYLSNL